jgi:hypothetical protein
LVDEFAQQNENRWTVLMLSVVAFCLCYRLLALVETYRVMSVPAREDRLRLIRHSMAEWGVDNDNGQYDGFCDRAEARLDRLPPSMIPEDLNVIDLASPVLPKHIKDAIQVVIENEIANVQTDLERGDTFTLTHDRLSHPFPPLKVDINQPTGKSKTVPRFPFEDLFRTNPEALNPFRRFTYQMFHSAPAYFGAQWHSQPASFAGQVWEAVVSHWMEHSGSACCFHCGQQRCLRWIGGRHGLAWGDVVCIECKSLYEIKSKATIEKVHKCLFEYNQVTGGSFLHYAKHRRLGKKYLVVVSRQPGKNGSYPIYGVEIETVTPQLTDKSFDLERDHPYIGSVLSFHAKAVHSNFIKGIVRPVPTDVNVSPAVVFNQHFGEGSWSRWQTSAKMDDLSSQLFTLQVSKPRPIKNHRTHPHTTVSPRAERFGRGGKSSNGPPPRFKTTSTHGAVDLLDDVSSSSVRFRLEDDFSLNDDIQYSAMYKIPSRKCKKWYNR